MDTGNNDLFLKLWTEVSYNDIDLVSGTKKWIPYDKGGEFRKWYGNNCYVLYWENNGYDLKKSTANLRSIHLYFKESITWNALSSSNTSFRFSNFKGSFDSAGSSMFPLNKDTYYYLGLMNSKIAELSLRIINPTLNFGAGSISNVPIVFNKDMDNRIDDVVSNSISISREDWDSYETSWDFMKSPLV